MLFCAVRTILGYKSIYFVYRKCAEAQLMQSVISSDVEFAHIKNIIDSSNSYKSRL